MTENGMIANFMGGVALADREQATRDNTCHGASDGECSWSECPQLRDNEPAASGRHCPLDVGCPRCCRIECEC